MRQFIHSRIAGAAIFAALLIYGISGSIIFSGCAHTVDYQIQHDTDTLIRHDTIPGPAFVRFLSILNNGTVSGIILLRTNGLQNTDLFTDVQQTMRKQFIPIPHDTSFFLYANYFIDASTQKSDSIAIPKLKSYSMTTIVIFRTTDPGDPNRLFPIFGDDSLRRQIAPKDSCYVRLINGLPDYPQPIASVNMHLDDIHAPPFFKEEIPYQEIRNYVLMPAGSHQIFVRSESDITQSYSASQNFLQGQFYTIKITGRHADGTDQLTIDSE
jgi:hypothetical protein